VPVEGRSSGLDQDVNVEDDGATIQLTSSWTGLDRFFFVPHALLAPFTLTLAVLMHEVWPLLLAVGFSVSAILSWRRYWPLKDITIDGDTVYATGFWRTINFPLSAVTAIELQPGSKPALMHLRVPTPFGHSLAFVPRIRTSRGENPLIEQVRERLRGLR